MPVGPIESSSIQGVALTESSIQKPEIGDQFSEFLSRANKIMQDSEHMSEDFAAGKHNNIHETMIAAERASITFKLVGAMRNRILNAYNDVMHMRM